MRLRRVEQPEHLGHRHHQVGAHLGGQRLAVALADLGVEYVQAVGDEFFVHGGQHAAVVDVVLHLFGVGQILGREHHTVALGAAPQQIVAGNIIIICHPHHKVQAALADAFFVVGQQCLRDPQILCRLLLGDAALLAQQLDDTIELHDVFSSISKGSVFGNILVFGLQQVDYTHWKTTCKARKMPIFFVFFRHYCQKSCPGPTSMLNYGY